jgi:hypothetical protein
MPPFGDPFDLMDENLAIRNSSPLPRERMAV